ncbi:unnamed protein product [Dibothriocephalus latus]|uniref:Uncharacterized protein n=1 Tax=Dibothriocephalus latus TaxID=60516 RepID=A0A3P7PUN4_DIBLA|nr:unnamed protein product [Dibothriocephalus latus]
MIPIGQWKSTFLTGVADSSLYTSLTCCYLPDLNAAAVAAGIDPYLNRLAVSYAALNNAVANTPAIYRTNSSYQRFSPY